MRKETEPIETTPAGVVCETTNGDVVPDRLGACRSRPKTPASLRGSSTHGTPRCYLNLEVHSFEIARYKGPTLKFTKGNRVPSVTTGRRGRPFPCASENGTRGSSCGKIK